jgi:hypothetical protein
MAFREACNSLQADGLFRTPKIYRAAVHLVILTTLTSDAFIVATVVGVVFQEEYKCARMRPAHRFERVPAGSTFSKDNTP